MLAGDVPNVLGGFVGRSREIAEIGPLLATARLFTLTGTGGSGKTRLAAQVAGRIRDTFRDGVRWVDLGALTDPSLVAHEVAARCGVADPGSAAVLDALVTALRPRHLLLALDNCEHLLTACAHLAEALLTACPDLHILATSREALAIPGEVIWLVPPLRVPGEDTLRPGEDLLAYEAVQLFVERAAEVLPGFQHTPENAASIVRICRRVEGLPLALELAAARLRALSLTELAERLDDASGVLTRGSRTAPPRQQTLRATLDWSYQLLPELERAVFRRLAVFAGSFSSAAAEGVCAGDGVDDVLGRLTHLVEQSLVIVEDRRDETRYRLIEPVRQYARGRLTESGEAPEAEEKHRSWYAAFAGRVEPELTGPDQGRVFDRLAAEHDNLRTALGWSLAWGDAEAAGRIALNIWQFWLLRGHFHEGRRWLEQILLHLPESTPPRANLLWVAGILARPDGARAELCFSESLAIWRALGDADGTARALGSLGFLAQAQGDHPKAIAYLEQSLPLLRASTDTPALARTLSSMAVSVLDAGDPERAMALCDEGLRLHRQLGDVRGVAAALANSGLISRTRGDEQSAGRKWEESLSLRRQIGDLGGLAHVLTLLGGLAVDQGTPARAAGLFQEGLDLRRRMGDLEGLASIIEGLSAVAAAGGEPTRAVQLAGAASSLRAAIGVPLPARDGHERMLAILRARLPAETFARAWDEGRALSLEEAMALAALPEAADLSASPAGPPLDSPSPASRSAGLTPREIEVLRLLTLGLTYARMAEELVISPRTVDAHVRAIFGKLDVRSRTAATRVALQQRLV